MFVALETKRLCKFVSLVMVWPGEQYISGAFQAQSSSAYSSLLPALDGMYSDCAHAMLGPRCAQYNSYLDHVMRVFAVGDPACRIPHSWELILLLYCYHLTITPSPHTVLG